MCAIFCIVGLLLGIRVIISKEDSITSTNVINLEYLNEFRTIYIDIIRSAKVYSGFIIFKKNDGENYSEEVKVLMSSMIIPFLVYNPFADNQSLKVTQKKRNNIDFELCFIDNFIVIIITTDLDYVSKIIEKSLKNGVIVVRSKILIISPKDQAQFLLIQFFQKLSNYQIFNVIFLSINNIFSGNYLAPKVSTFNPFLKEFIQIVNSNNFFRDKTENLYGGIIHVPLMPIIPNSEKICKNNRCTWRGDNFEMLRPLAEYYNATVEILYHEKTEFGFEKALNQTLSIVLQGAGLNILEGKCNFSLKPRFLYKSRFFDFTYPYNFNNMVCLVPKAKHQQQYTAIFHSIDNVSKIFIIFSMLGILIGIKISFKILHFHKKYSNLEQNISLKLYSVLFAQSLNIKSEFYSIRILLAIWFLFCILITAVFNKGLFTLLVNPPTYNNIDSPLYALQNPEWEPITFSDLEEVIKSSKMGSPEIHALLKQRLKGVHRDVFYKRALEATDGFVLVLNDQLADYLIRRTQLKDGKHFSYHKTKPIASQMHSNIVLKGSPLYNSLNRFELMAIETGLRHYWSTRDYWPRLHSTNDEETKTILGLQHLRIAFLILALGNTISLVIFLMELLYNRII